MKLKLSLKYIFSHFLLLMGVLCFVDLGIAQTSFDKLNYRDVKAFDDYVTISFDNGDTNGNQFLIPTHLFITKDKGFEPLLVSLKDYFIKDQIIYKDDLYLHVHSKKDKTANRIIKCSLNKFKCETLIISQEYIFFKFMLDSNKGELFALADHRDPKGKNSITYLVKIENNKLEFLYHFGFDTCTFIMPHQPPVFTNNGIIVINDVRQTDCIDGSTDSSKELIYFDFKTKQVKKDDFKFFMTQYYKDKNKQPNTNLGMINSVNYTAETDTITFLATDWRYDGPKINDYRVYFFVFCKRDGSLCKEKMIEPGTAKKTSLLGFANGNYSAVFITENKYIRMAYAKDTLEITRQENFSYDVYKAKRIELIIQN